MCNSHQYFSERTIIVSFTHCTGTQSPVSVWGITGEVSEIICTVPDSLTYSTLSDITWHLDGNPVPTSGVTYNLNNQVYNSLPAKVRE